ncbi:MAG: hypothetical protein KGI54_18390 [Pseudomonadota bacterium]|nr:hypothetical protein [Pseudomonadota bacterium]
MNTFVIKNEPLSNLKILLSAMHPGVNPELKSELEREIERREAAQRWKQASELAIAKLN